MGIKSLVMKAAGRAGDTVAKASGLSSDQVRSIEERRNQYLGEMPDPKDAVAVELTHRMMAACGVDIHNAYLPRLTTVYAPISANAEYGKDFDASRNVRIVRIDKWIVDAEENSLEKLANVYGALANESCNIALVFHRGLDRSEAYLAVVDTGNSDNSADVVSFKDRLVASLKGNFPGSDISDEGLTRLPCLDADVCYSVAAVSNIPAEKSQMFISQTIEKLLDGVVPGNKDQEYTLILLANPASDLEQRKLHLSTLYSVLTPYAEWQTTFTFNESDAASSTATVGVNLGVSAGSQRGMNASVGESENVCLSDSETIANSTETSKSTTRGLSAGVEARIKGIADLHGEVSVSHTRGTSAGRSVARMAAKAVTKGVSTSAGVMSAFNVGGNFGTSFSRASSVTATIGKGEGLTQNFKNHSVMHALETLEAQMKRLDAASALGVWDFAAYVLSEDHRVVQNVAHSYLSLTQGEESYLSQSVVNFWRGDLATGSEEAQAICDYLLDLRHPAFALRPALLDAESDFASYPSVVDATTVLTGKELAWSLNFPRKSIAGLPVIQCAAFGRNVTTFDGSQKVLGIKLGSVFHMHKREKEDVCLDLESLASHIFVTGSTGTGKTNTVCRILDQAAAEGARFLVIEPAKGEYKHIYGCRDNVLVFGTNPAFTPLLRLNPFSFPANVHVLEHLDRLVEVFNVCWPMYAAMPAVLKSAVQRSYQDCGWDLIESVNPYGEGLYPCFSDVARNVRSILDSSEYDAENKGAYKGSLLTRLESLTNGLNGMILADDEIDAATLFDQNVIVDLSRIGSVETKSLLMGLLVIKLQEHRMAEDAVSNRSLWHLTVLEEAHNLLKRTSAQQTDEGSNLAGKSVEMLSNAIAEMRAYGEGFIIADQAPGLLDMAAIRNTNTKIIMRLPDLSDRELVGRAANLNDDQIAELARLPKGVAAVYQNDWIEPVLCAVRKVRGAAGWTYERPLVQPAESFAYQAIQIIELLGECQRVDDAVHLKSLNESMQRMGLSSSLRVLAIKMLTDPPKELMMTKIAPIAAALFPEAAKAGRQARDRSDSTVRWTEDVEDALSLETNGQLRGHTERVIVQGIMTELLLHDLRDEGRYRDWQAWWK